MAALQEAHEKTLPVGHCTRETCARSSAHPEHRRRFRHARIFPGMKRWISRRSARICGAFMPDVRQAPAGGTHRHRAWPLSRGGGGHLRLPRDRAKESRGQIFLVTDGGLHHHLAASGNFGQVIRKNYPVVVGNRVQGAEKGSCFGGGTALHTAGSSGRPHGDEQGGSRRSYCRVPVRRIRLDR